MLSYPAIDPIAFSVGPLFGLGPLRVHWYGIMYLIGFSAAWLLAQLRARRPGSPIERQQIDDLIVYAALGVIIGGRFGYVLFYNFDKLIADPLWLFRLWEGGMSFHGGLLGVLAALALFAFRIHRPFLAIADFVAPLVPIGLGLGRLGNFIGQELWGRATALPWGVIFPRDPEHLVRHPSQLYQATLEGLVLFTVLFWYSRRPRPAGAVGGLFLVLYGVFRLVAEFFREPDRQVGFDLFDWLTRGQLLSLPMILAGALLMRWASRREPPTPVEFLKR